MSTWIDAITSSPLEPASEIGQGWMRDRDQIKFRDTVTELQAEIRAGQQAASAAQSREAEMIGEIRALKARIAELEAWEGEKRRYQLERLPPNVFVLTLKPEMAGSETPHSICRACYQLGKKAILRSDEIGNGIHHLICPECDTVLQVGHFKKTSRARRPETHLDLFAGLSGLN